MVRLAALWERSFLLVIFATLALSTGLAAAVPQDWDAVSGHTSYVTGVLYVEPPERPDLPHILYGLATHREVRLFGLWATERPAPESQDRMVFVWSKDAPDPRDEVLQPTGDFARVRDRTGAVWTVYEFQYAGPDALHHTYGVRIGALHRADDPSVGEKGAYNHVLVYRPDRLLAVPLPTTDPGVPEGAQSPDDPMRPLPTLQDTLDTVHALRSQEARERPHQAVRIALGQGDVPAALQASDPAAQPPSLLRVS